MQNINPTSWPAAAPQAGLSAGLFSSACHSRPSGASLPAAASNAQSPFPAGLLLELLEELDTPVVVCAEDGAVAVANSAARHELMVASPLGVDAAGSLRLAPGAQACEWSWRQALRNATQLGKRQLLALRDDSHTLMVSVMPLGTLRQQGQAAAGVSVALVMLARRQPAPALAVQMLSKLFALTSAEQGVLTGLLAGERVEAIAVRRGVKLSTLRTQVSAVREKLGARRLEDLVRIASELPPISGVLRSPALLGVRWCAAAPGQIAHRLAQVDTLSS
jgi:DNA-binding NarL/FixJ family response regulator